MHFKFALPFSLIFGVLPAYSQVDTVVTVVSNANAVGGVTTPPALGTFGYDPVNDRIFVAGFTSADQQLRLISNVSGTQTVQTQVFATGWALFDRGGTAPTGGSPTPGSLLLNPKPVTNGTSTIPAYSFALLDDADLVQPAGSVGNSQRIYSYNLQASGTTVGNPASDVFTSYVTQAQYAAAAGGTVGISTNIARQFAWSGDGQSIYFADTSTSAGGIWKEAATGGAPVRLLTGGSDLNTEPAVITSGNVDSIYFRGGGSTSTNNTGGIDKITYDGTTASARTIAVSAATINNFLELTGSASASIASMASDSAGNLFFNDTGNKGGIYELDAQGRLSKVISKAERQAVFGVGTTSSVNGNTLRMQPRTTTYTGSAGSFSVEQILYAESSPFSLIAGAYVFKPGDFNRDNVVNQNDVNLLKTEVTTRGVQKTNAADLKYDMNGNGAVDWKDIKIFQQFDPNLYDGDANMDGKVDIADLGILATNYGQSGISWLGGDFTGDDTVNVADLGTLATNYGMGASTPMEYSFAQALQKVGLGGVQVPEPGLLSLIGGASLAFRRRSKHYSATR